MLSEPELLTALLFDELPEERVTARLEDEPDERLTAEEDDRLELRVTAAGRLDRFEERVTEVAERLELLRLIAADRFEELLLRFTAERLFELEDRDLFTDPEELLDDRFLCIFPLLLFEEERFVSTLLRLLEVEEDRLLTVFDVPRFRTVAERLLTRALVLVARFTWVLCALERSVERASVRLLIAERDRIVLSPLLRMEVMPDDLRPVLLGRTVREERPDRVL